MSSVVSHLTLNRLSLYLRCLRQLEADGITHVSSGELARRFDLSAPQIRKDLACFGDFGIRGVGYDVVGLVRRLRSLLDLDRQHSLIVVGVGDLGSAVARHFSRHHKAFAVVGAFDVDPDRIGRPLESLTIQPLSDLPESVRSTGAEIGVLAVPATAAQEVYDLLVEAGIRSILNFAPVQLRRASGVRTKTVDLRIHLEELVFYSAADSALEASIADE